MNEVQKGINKSDKWLTLSNEVKEKIIQLTIERNKASPRKTYETTENLYKEIHSALGQDPGYGYYSNSIDNIRTSLNRGSAKGDVFEKLKDYLSDFEKIREAAHSISKETNKEHIGNMR